MKQTKRSNFRVEIVPGFWEHRLHQPDAEEYQNRETEDLVEEIKRHVPEASNARVVWHSEEVCEYCDYAWEEDDDGCPVCCNKAVAEWEGAREAEQEER